MAKPSVSGEAQDPSVPLPSLAADTSRGCHSHQPQLHRVLWGLTPGDPESNNPEFTARLLSPCDLRHLIYLSNLSFLTCKMGREGTPLSQGCCEGRVEGSNMFQWLSAKPSWAGAQITPGIIFRVWTEGRAQRLCSTDVLWWMTFIPRKPGWGCSSKTFCLNKPAWL